MEKNSNLDSHVETDNRQSIRYTQQDETIRQIALGTQNFELRPPPENTRGQPPLQRSTIQSDSSQCARLRNDSDFESHAAIEESSPYSSLDDEKYEAQVPSNNISETRNRRESLLVHSEVVDLYARASASEVVQTQHFEPSGKCVQESTEGFGEMEALIPTGSLKERPVVKINPYVDVNLRLATFLTMDWPHEKPSPEQMADAGMVYLGVYFIKEKNEYVYDMVECYKCRRTMYAFKETDDPTEEHRRLYPDCT